MAYYAALISLEQTIQRLLNSSQISILSSSREILESVCKKVRSFDELVLQRNEKIIISHSSNERVTSLKGQIRDAAYKLEDVIESHALAQFESLANEVFLDFEEVKQEINSFIETMEAIKKTMMEEFRKPLPEEEEDDDVPLKFDSGGNNSKMVGLLDQFIDIKNSLLRGSGKISRARDSVSIVGMAGIGKTALAMKLFEDPEISSRFDCRAFVTIGQKFQLRKVMLSIVAQINHDHIDEIRMKEDKKLAEYILTSLRGKRCLIVLDDVWNREVAEYIRELLRGVVLLTTRLREVAQCTFLRTMRFMNKEESWDLLCEKVFGEGHLCPLRLEKYGKKIAENCEGLPLTIITVASILCKEEKTVEYWKKVARKENSVFTDAYDQMWEVLIKSYNYLPQRLKPFFLYIGVFPESCEIPVSTLTKLWHAEGFLNLCSSSGFEKFAKVCLYNLASASIVLKKQLSSRWSGFAKTCKLHSVYWYLCVTEAGKEKFMHVTNRYPSSFTEVIENQRRLCIHNNVLFSIKKAHNSMESISMVHSLLCTGPHHQYPVPICFGFKLLRVLDALTIRFYKFPIEVLKLVQLRYLALKYSGKVPGSVSSLWNLEHLIIFRHLSINKSSKDSSYLPIEIWNMKALRHIQVTGSNLPDPCTAFLPNLLTLSNMSANNCSKEILERTPNLTRLGIQIELTPDVVEPICYFDHLSHLRCLESFKCVVVNPKPRSQVFAPIMTFPSNLEKLSLSGLGYPWKYMTTIGKLPKLKVLKLRCYAFQGPVWEVSETEFQRLEYLLLEDTDLVQWTFDKDRHLAWSVKDPVCFSWLDRLIISHCYKLKEIPLRLGSHFYLRLMKLDDCPSLRASYVETLRNHYRTAHIDVYSSLHAEKKKL
ncbi:Apoptotic ATPase [Handroanthus impetiginosus]|uniref:Apoptotic ATPase n=1 Tax=Handroanthus impetiginosus TaxID=429701 RepID=A0A2G9G2M6_9LAMI|nr:Apoptotic ATPase [Handroanthus impetiginosus]